MTGDELRQARAARWAELRPAEVSADALHAWVRNLGFVTLPTLAEWSEAAPEMLERELGELRLIELYLWPGVHRYAAAELLEFVYVCVGDRNPRRDFKKQAGQGRLSWLAAEVYEYLLQHPRSRTSLELRDAMGAARTSVLGIERALAELAATLKVLRVGGNRWRALAQALPEVPAAIDRISQLEAAAALVSQYLDVMVCDTEESIAAFFSPLLSRSRVRDAVNGLEVRRELRLESLEGRPALRLAARPTP